jgi:hypothetical protein
MPTYQNNTDTTFHTRNGGTYGAGEEKSVNWYENDPRLTKISDEPIPAGPVVHVSEDVELGEDETRTFMIPTPIFAGHVLCSVIALSGSAMLTYNDETLGVPVDSLRSHVVRISSRCVEKITLKGVEDGVFGVTIQEDTSLE